MTQRTCSIGGCELPVSARGLCRHHYNQAYYYGDLDKHDPKPPAVRPKPPCTVDGCEREEWSSGLCGMHYQRQRNHGTTHKQTIEERFWSKVDKRGPDECWPWIGAFTSSGYGDFMHLRPSSPGAFRARAHRFAYELLVGPIPAGLVLDHLCRNPPCVNPAHLEPVTHRENVLRGIAPTAENARKTHCTQGHEYTPENTYVTRSHGRTGRVCRTCHRKRVREAKRQKREAAKRAA